MKTDKLERKRGHQKKKTKSPTKHQSPTADSGGFPGLALLGLARHLTDPELASFARPPLLAPQWPHFEPYQGGIFENTNRTGSTYTLKIIRLHNPSLSKPD